MSKSKNGEPQGRNSSIAPVKRSAIYAIRAAAARDRAISVYFCGDASNINALAETEPPRVSKCCQSLVNKRDIVVLNAFAIFRSL
jgi:hypothetical protein